MNPTNLIKIKQIEILVNAIEDKLSNNMDLLYNIENKFFDFESKATLNRAINELNHLIMSIDLHLESIKSSNNKE